MNLFFRIVRLSFILFLAATFVVFIAAVGGFGGIIMTEVAMVAAGGLVGCAWVIWASDIVVNSTGG